MKRILFSVITASLLFVSCAPINTTENIPTIVAVQETSPVAIVSEPVTTIIPSLTSQPTLIPTLTKTPDLVALKTQGVNEPWITATLDTKFSPPWYSQRVIFSPNNKFLVSSYGNKISLWDVGTYKKLNEFVVLNEHYGVERFAFSSNDRFLALTAYYWDDSNSHLFVWDTTLMAQIFSMELEPAILVNNAKYSDHYPATTLAFVPNSTRLVTANGNSVQIIDLEKNNETMIINLGNEMYASDISFPNDGRFIYVFMKWLKDNRFSSYPRYQTKYSLQIWDTNSHFLWRTIEYLGSGWAWPISKELHDSYLVTKDASKGTFEMMNLENNKVNQLPYRDGWDYITADNNYILFFRYHLVQDKDEKGIEFWTTDSWRMLYKLKPEVYDYPDKSDPMGSDPGEIAINNDNTLLAIAYAGQVFIYDIRILTAP